MQNPRFFGFQGRILTAVYGLPNETNFADNKPGVYRECVLTGISGNGKNLSGATSHKLTFINMALDDAFMSAGGVISADGLSDHRPARSPLIRAIRSLG